MQKVSAGQSGMASHDGNPVGGGAHSPVVDAAMVQVADAGMGQEVDAEMRQVETGEVDMEGTDSQNLGRWLQLMLGDTG